MKLKILPAIVIIALITYNQVKAQCPGAGELKICVINPTSNKFILNYSSVGYSWNYSFSQIIPVSSYDRTSNNIITGNYRFDAPNDKNAGLDSILWGKFYFTIKSLDTNNYEAFSRSFYLDLTDENWSKGESYSDYQRDTWIIIDQSGLGNIYLKGYDYSGNEITGNLFQNETVNIWTFLGAGSPLQSNFKFPVVLHNYLENNTTNFGYLKSNGIQFSSGTSDNIKDGINNTVEQVTTDKIDNGINYQSFKWEYSNANVNSGQNIYSGQNQYKITNAYNTKSIIRRFKIV